MIQIALSNRVIGVCWTILVFGWQTTYLQMYLDLELLEPLNHHSSFLIVYRSSAGRFTPLSCPLREEVVRGLDEREHEAEILAEVAELQAEATEDYERKMVEYRRHLEEWRSWRRKQVPSPHHCNFCSGIHVYNFSTQTVLIIDFRKPRRRRRRRDSSLKARKRKRRTSRVTKSWERRERNQNLRRNRTLQVWSSRSEKKQRRSAGNLENPFWFLNLPSRVRSLQMSSVHGKHGDLTHE